MITQRDGFRYKLAYVPSDFTYAKSEEFDRGYMSALFQVGYEGALMGYPWKSEPPGM